MNRRGFLAGLGAALAAPAIVKAGVLMPIKSGLVSPVIAYPLLTPDYLDKLINPPVIAIDVGVVRLFRDEMVRTFMLRRGSTTYVQTTMQEALNEISAHPLDH